MATLAAEPGSASPTWRANCFHASRNAHAAAVEAVRDTIAGLLEA
jgi:hypothetical protein